MLQSLIIDKFHPVFLLYATLARVQQILQLDEVGIGVEQVHAGLIVVNEQITVSLFLICIFLGSSVLAESCISAVQGTMGLSEMSEPVKRC